MSSYVTYSSACHPRVIRVYSEGKLHNVRLSRVLFLAGKNGKTTFYRKNKSALVANHHLGYFEKLLPCCFARVHQGFIVNFHHLESRSPTGHLYLDTEVDHKIWLGKTYEAAFHNAYDLWNNRIIPLPPPGLPIYTPPNLPPNSEPPTAP